MKASSVEGDISSPHASGLKYDTLMTFWCQCQGIGSAQAVFVGRQEFLLSFDSGEAAVGEAGAMMYMQSDIQMDTVFGDGSQQGGLFGKLRGAGKRLLTGESLFFATLRGPGLAAIAAALQTGQPHHCLGPGGGRQVGRAGFAAGGWVNRRADWRPR